MIASISIANNEELIFNNIGHFSKINNLDVQIKNGLKKQT